MDYVAVLVLVVVVVLAAAGVAGASGVDVAVRRQVLRALCLVGRGDCEQDRAACTTRTRREERSVAVTVMVVRLEGRRGVVLEQRSDGTIAVSESELRGAGLRLAAGAGARLAGLGLGGEMSATVLASGGDGRTWIVRDRAAADRLVGRLRGGGAGELPAPDVTFRSGGLRSAGEGSLRRGRVGATVGLVAEDVKGERVERATGRRTVYLERVNDASLMVAGLAGGGAGAGGRYAVTFDRDGRPVDLVVTSSGRYSTGVTLPRRLQGVARLLGAPTSARRQWSEEAHLDLTDPVNFAVARDFLGEVVGSSEVHVGRRAAVARALADRIDAVGVIHARTYEEVQSARGFGARVGAGVGVGVDVEAATTTMRLVGASTRGLDGVWRVRGDCLVG